MATKNENISVAYKSTHPGEVLAEWIEDVGVKQKDFAASIDLPASRLNELLKGKRPMTMEIAKKVEERLGMRASYWMELQANYEYNERMLALRNEEQKLTDSQEQSLRASFNLSELYKHLKINYVSSIRRVRELFSKLDTTYEGILTKTAIVGYFKHSDTLNVNEQNMRTWVLLAQYEASKATPDGKYSKERADIAAKEIAKKANGGELKEEEIRDILSSAGIAYTILKHLKGCPIDAYSLKIKDVPAIVVTHRHNNMQKLIFDILHEICHITKHMTDSNCDFINTEYSQNHPLEKEANTYAQNTLIPEKTWKDIIGTALPSAKPDTIFNTIGQRAKTFGIDPHIAIARYKHDSRRYAGRLYGPTHII